MSLSRFLQTFRYFSVLGRKRVLFQISMSFVFPFLSIYEQNFVEQWAKSCQLCLYTDCQINLVQRFLFVTHSKLPHLSYDSLVTSNSFWMLIASNLSLVSPFPHLLIFHFSYIEEVIPMISASQPSLHNSTYSGQCSQRNRPVLQVLST